MLRALATSLGGEWVLVRDGGQARVLARDAATPTATVTLADGDDTQLGWLGPPATLAIVTRAECVLLQPPAFEPIARVELATPHRLAAITGPRGVLTPLAVSEGKVIVVRVAARAAASSVLEVGAPIELAVGLDRDQVVFALPRQLVAWDVAASRPSAKLQLPLPPPPRSVGVAAGHLWAMRHGAHELYVFRLSDGRPFRHVIGAPIVSVVSHPASPLVVIATEHGLVRLHCFAHSLAAIDAAAYAPGTPLALLVAGDDVVLLGLPDRAELPWRIALTGAAATQPAPTASRAPVAPPAPAASAAPAARPAPPPQWRDALVAFARASADALPPVIAPGTELAELADHLALAPAARHALAVLYAFHLIGEPALAIARLARATGDWSEPLGQGELAALAMLRRRRGTVALRHAVTDVLDGAAPRAVRLIGDAPPTRRFGALRVARDGRSDAEIEHQLAAQLGRIAIVTGPISAALLDARMRGATAVAFTAPAERPHPWPVGASLVLVLYGSPTSWVADLPALDVTAS